MVPNSLLFIPRLFLQSLLNVRVIVKLLLKIYCGLDLVIALVHVRHIFLVEDYLVVYLGASVVEVLLVFHLLVYGQR